MAEIVYFVITVGILVFVHEAGHFLAAKASKMRADVFAIGFGYRLFGYNKITGFTFGKLADDFDGQGNTDYRLCVFPLGGYVKVAGMVDESMDAAVLSKPPMPWEFRAKPMLPKLFVISAGVLMNLLLAFLIFWGTNFFIGEQRTKSTVLGYVSPKSTAYNIGFRADDQVVSVNGAPIQYWEDIRNNIFIMEAGKDVSVVVLRNGKQETVFAPRDSLPAPDKSSLFLLPKEIHVAAGKIEEGVPAYTAGIKEGDAFLQVNETPVVNVDQLIELISSSPGKQLTMRLLRGTDTVTVAVTPNEGGKIGVPLGLISYAPIEHIGYGFLPSFSKAGGDIVRITGLTFTMLERVISGKLQFKQAFGGPVKIAQFAAQSAEGGASAFLLFIAMLSLSLAIINILPIPALDGGHLIIILIEGIMMREIPLKIKMAVQQVGFFLLLGLMAIVLYFDIFVK